MAQERIGVIKLLHWRGMDADLDFLSEVLPISLDGFTEAGGSAQVVAGVNFS